jgi:hypothetical protein
MIEFERASRKVSRDEFSYILGVMKTQPWLERVEEALLNLFDECSSPDQQKLIAELLLRTHHISENGFGDAIRAIGARIEDVWNLEPANTYFVSSNDQENTDSSQEVLNRLKAYPWRSTAWSRRQFLIRYRDVGRRLKNHDCVVIVDDFIGTGNSMVSTLDWFRKFAAASSLAIDLRVCAVAGCASGLEIVSAACSHSFFVNSIRKAISDHYSGAELASASKIMTDIEDQLEAISTRPKKFADYRFGFGKSEAMYYRDGGNTPNNVFPAFWWRSVKRRARQTVMNRT